MTQQDQVRHREKCDPWMHPRTLSGFSKAWVDLHFVRLAVWFTSMRWQGSCLECPWKRIQHCGVYPHLWNRNWLVAYLHKGTRRTFDLDEAVSTENGRKQDSRQIRAQEIDFSDGQGRKKKRSKRVRGCRLQIWHRAKKHHKGSSHILLLTSDNRYTNRFTFRAGLNSMLNHTC